VDKIAELLEALADAARDDRKSDFDRLERELLTSFDGSFDSMPPAVYAKYLEVDRLWPVVSPSADGEESSGDLANSRRRALRVSLSARDEAWLRQFGAATDRSLSAVLAACLAEIQANPDLADAVQRRLDRPRTGP
jgi:hypothetical protein